MTLLLKALKKCLLGFTVLTMMTITSIVFAEPININTADVPTIIENLKDIGPVKAQAIVDYRDEHGAFKNAQDLLAVKGVGEKTIEKNIDILLFTDKPSNEQ